MIDKLLLSICVCLAVFTARADALAPRGEARSLVSENLCVAVPEKPSIQETYAARLLASTLERLCGGTVPVVAEAAAVPPYISIGETASAAAAGFRDALPPQSYAIEFTGGNCFIRGGTPGPLNGVLALLEEDLGCRLYTNDVAVFPDWSGKPLKIVPRRFTPPFEMRELMYMPDNHDASDWPMWNRLAPISWHTLLPPESGGQLASGYFIHTYAALVPPEEYYDEHPEYYAMQDGKRVRIEPWLGALCYTNREVPKIIVGRIRAKLTEQPELRIFSISSPDTSRDECECPACAKLIQNEGIAGAQVALANAVAEELAPEFPDIRLTFLSYGSDRPKTIRHHANLVNFYAPIGARANRDAMLVPLGENNRITVQMDEWLATGVKTYFWDYIDLSCYPFPNFDAEAAGLRDLAGAGIKGYFADCTIAWTSLFRLKRWVFAKLMWDPERELDSLIAEFVAAYYGEAAEPMREYVAIQRAAWERFIAEWRSRPGQVNFHFNDRELGAMRAALDAACAAVSSETLRERVGLERLCFSAMLLDANPRVVGIECYAAELEIARSLLHYIPDNAHLKTTGLPARWAKKLAWAESAPPDAYSPGTVAVESSITVAGMSELADDPAALDGQTVRHFGGKPWGVQYYYDTFRDYLIPGETYVLRMRVRSEVKPGSAAASYTLRNFRHGDEEFNAKQPQMGVSVPAGGDYRWMVLGKVVFENPDATGMFWLDAHVGVDEAICYDRLELIPLSEYRETEKVPDVTIHI